MASVYGYAEPLRILCTRELQNSIKESFHAELKNAIASIPWLAEHYDVGVDYIKGKNGTEFIFRGLRHNLSSIKSLSNIDLCIVEEAEDVPEAAWEVLEPTIRKNKAEIWVVWNPCRKGSPTDKRFRINPPSRSVIAEINWRDNPKFPDRLKTQRERAQKIMEPAKYEWIWEGKYYEKSDAQIFRNFRVMEFVPGEYWDGPYIGLDFGFAVDPTAVVKCWVNDSRLWVEHEAGKVGLELDDTPEFLINNIPDISKHTIRADSARPESISYLRRKGLPGCMPVDKGKGSVEDGIEFIKSFDEIILHPRCTKIKEEFENYSYKVDRLSGDILPEIVDAWNHYCDSLRYALEPAMQAHMAGADGFSSGASMLSASDY